MSQGHDDGGERLRAAATRSRCCFEPWVGIGLEVYGLAVTPLRDGAWPQAGLVSVGPAVVLLGASTGLLKLLLAFLGPRGRRRLVPLIVPPLLWKAPPAYQQPWRAPERHHWSAGSPSWPLVSGAKRPMQSHFTPLPWCVGVGNRKCHGQRRLFHTSRNVS